MGRGEYRGRRAHRFGRGEGGQALTEGAVADLIVILEKAHEARGEARARLAPRPAAIGRPLALIGEALGEAAGEMGQWGLVVLVVAAPLAREHDVQGVMEIVVPLGEKERALVRPGSGEEPRLVGVVLEHEMHEAITARPFGHRARQLGEHVVARSRPPWHARRPGAGRPGGTRRASRARCARRRPARPRCPARRS